MVGGDPAVLNDCGNDLMTTSTELFDGRTAMAREGVFQRSALGHAASGTVIDTAYANAVEAVARAAANLQSTLSEDGYHLQRGSRDIDTVMNRCTPSEGGGPHRQIPV